MTQQLDTVRAIYQAFSIGDIPAILARLDPACAWDAGHPSYDIPWFVARHGREEIAAFFGVLGGLEFHRFEVVNLLEGANQVASVVDIDITVKATGRRFAEQELHLWTFGADGAVTAFRHLIDTALHREAAGV